MKIIRVTGLIEIEDSEYDEGPLGPLTQEAHEFYSGITPSSERVVPYISDLTDLEFEVEE